MLKMRDSISMVLGENPTGDPSNDEESREVADHRGIRGFDGVTHRLPLGGALQ
jgi:hypothetical protein